MHRCSLCHSAPMWVFREQIGTRGVLGPATAQAFSSFGASTKLLLVWLRGSVHTSQYNIKLHYLIQKIFSFEKQRVGFF